MELYVFVAFLIVGGLVGLWQCWLGWRTGKMFAFDPGYSAAGLGRQEHGWLFLFGWWFTLIVSLVAFGLAAGFVMHG
jgi:hypothetical protein